MRCVLMDDIAFGDTHTEQTRVLREVSDGSREVDHANSRDQTVAILAHQQSGVAS